MTDLTAWAEPGGLTRAEPLKFCDNQLLVPLLANIIRRDEKQVTERFNPCFAMSADVSLDLGTSPVSPVPSIVRANKCYGSGGFPRACPLPRPHQNVPIVSLLRDCLCTLASGSDWVTVRQPGPGLGHQAASSASTNLSEVFLVVQVIVALLDTTNTRENSPLCPRTALPPPVSPAIRR